MNETQNALAEARRFARTEKRNQGRGGGEPRELILPTNTTLSKGKMKIA